MVDFKWTMAYIQQFLTYEHRKRTIARDRCNEESRIDNPNEFYRRDTSVFQRWDVRALICALVAFDEAENALTSAKSNA